MITVVMLLFFPAIFTMSVYRLYQLPKDVLAGRKWLNPKNRLAYGLSSAIAYLALAAYTVLVIDVIGGFLIQSPKTLNGLFTVSSALATYTLVYLAYEWLYHYAFDPRPTSH